MAYPHYDLMTPAQKAVYDKSQIAVRLVFDILKVLCEEAHQAEQTDLASRADSKEEFLGKPIGRRHMFCHNAALWYRNSVFTILPFASPELKEEIMSYYERIGMA
jgi:hypothetical protein